MRLARFASIGLAVAALAGCSALDRINNIGEAPKMTDIQNPAAATGHRPISMPMPPKSMWAICSPCPPICGYPVNASQPRMSRTATTAATRKRSSSSGALTPCAR